MKTTDKMTTGTILLFALIFLWEFFQLQDVYSFIKFIVTGVIVFGVFFLLKFFIKKN